MLRDDINKALTEAMKAKNERTVSTLLGGKSDPVITKKPEGAWTHSVIEAAMKK